jgi:uncharacterized repeat protein (TIGR02543 family)
LNPAGSTYTEGTSVTITATPSTGYQFNNWSGSISGTANPVTTTVNSNISVTANFTPTGNPGNCTSPATVTLPFAKDGAGEFCYVISGNISFVNSWNTSLVEINGVDYTNKWSNSMPARVNGNYYVRYVGPYAWSHFEATGSNAVTNQSAARLQSLPANTIDEKEAVVIYPNPVTQRSFRVRFSDQTLTNVTVTLIDLYGKVVFSKEVKNNQPLSLPAIAAGIYQVTVATKEKKVMTTKLIIR